MSYLTNKYRFGRRIQPKTHDSLLASKWSRCILLSLSMVSATVPSLGVIQGAHAAGLGDLFNKADGDSGQKKFLPVEKAFSVDAVQQGNVLTVSMDITPGHYLYKDRLSFSLPEGVESTPLKFSHSSQLIDDPTFGKVAVFKQKQLTATTTLTNTTTQAIKQDVTLTWQGCAEAGLCYPPQKQQVAVSLPAASKASAHTKAEETVTSKSATSNTATSQSVETGNTANSSTVKSATTNTAVAQTNQSASNTNHPGSKSLTDNSKELSDQSLAGEQQNQQGNNVNSASTLATDETEIIATNAANQTDAFENNGNNLTVATDTEATGSSSEGVKAGWLNDSGIVDQDPFGLGKHPLLAFLLLFIAGLGLALTPCVLPMLPIVSNIVARQHTPTAKKGLMLSGSYALGVSTAYGILGAIIAIFGQSLGIIGWLQNPVILIGFAVIFILLALYMIDAFTFPVPASIKNKLHGLSQRGDRYLGSATGSFIAGLLSALVVSPCVSAPLFGALLAVSTIGNPLLGFMALFMLGLGLSSPLILLGIGQSNLMPKAGMWMNWVKQGFALLLFGVALLLIARVLISPIMLMMWAVWFAVVAYWAWHWDGRGQLLTKPCALVLMIWSAITLVGAALGSVDAWQPLDKLTHIQSTAKAVNVGNSTDRQLLQNTSQDANVGISPRDIKVSSLDDLIPIIENENKVLVDVTAEWCVECHIMDKTLFSNRPASLQDWQVVRLDITETNEDSVQVLSELKIFGPPVLLYFVNGELKEQQVGLVKREEFETVLNRL